MSKAKQYRKKPVVIEAIEFTGDNAAEVWDFIPAGCAHLGEGDEIIIETLEGDMRAKPGCFIIRGWADEYYPCDGDIFRETYEPVG